MKIRAFEADLLIFGGGLAGANAVLGRQCATNSV